MAHHYDRISREHFSTIQAIEEERERFDFNRFINERKRIAVEPRHPRITTRAQDDQLRLGKRPSLLGDYPGDIQSFSPSYSIKKPRSRSLGRRPIQQTFGVGTKPKFQQIFNNCRTAKDDSEPIINVKDLKTDELENEIKTESNKNQENNSEIKQGITTGDENINKTLPSRIITKSDSGIKISAVLKDIDCPNVKVNQTLPSDSFRKLYGESITKLEDDVSASLVKLPIVKFNCETYNSNNVPEYSDDLVTGGDGVTIELFYKCKYCNMFGDGCEIMAHLKSRYHYNRYKSYLETGAVLSSGSESDNEESNGLEDNKEAITFTNNVDGGLANSEVHKGTEDSGLNENADKGNPDKKNQKVIFKETESSKDDASDKSESLILELNNDEDILSSSEDERDRSTPQMIPERGRSWTRNRDNRSRKGGDHKPYKRDWKNNRNDVSRNTQWNRSKERGQYDNEQRFGRPQFNCSKSKLDPPNFAERSQFDSPRTKFAEKAQCANSTTKFDSPNLTEWSKLNSSKTKIDATKFAERSQFDTRPKFPENSQLECSTSKLDSLKFYERSQLDSSLTKIDSPKFAERPVVDSSAMLDLYKSGESYQFNRTDLNYNESSKFDSSMKSYVSHRPHPPKFDERPQHDSSKTNFSDRSRFLDGLEFENQSLKSCYEKIKSQLMEKESQRFKLSEREFKKTD